MSLNVSLEDLIPLPAEVPTGRGNLKVRGLGIEEISALMTNNAVELASLLDDKDPNFDGFFAKFPKLSIQIVAVAAEAEGQEALIAKLPGPVIIEALMEVWKITVPNPKKLEESLSGALAALKQAMATVKKNVPAAATKLPKKG